MTDQSHSNAKTCLELLMLFCKKHFIHPQTFLACGQKDNEETNFLVQRRNVSAYNLEKNKFFSQSAKI